MALFNRKPSKPSIAIADVDQLLELAGQKGGLDGVVKKVADIVQTLRVQASGLNKDADGSQTKAEAQYDEATRVARQELNATMIVVTTMRDDATAKLAQAGNAAALLAKIGNKK